MPLQDAAPAHHLCPRRLLVKKAACGRPHALAPCWLSASCCTPPCRANTAAAPLWLNISWLPECTPLGCTLSITFFPAERVRWRREQALSPASQAELEALLGRAAALLEAAGISAEESSGGGNNSNHGRRKKLMGHVRALLLRSQASTAEVRALHGLCKELEGRQQQEAAPAAAASAPSQQHQQQGQH